MLRCAQPKYAPLKSQAFNQKLNRLVAAARTPSKSSSTSRMASTSSGQQGRSILWFRKGLRLHDNPALRDACTGSAAVFPIFIIDPYFLQKSNNKVGVNRYQFLLESLSDLNSSLTSLGSQLLVLRGTPEEVIPRVLRDWSIKKLCYEIDTEPYAKARDARVDDMAREAGVEVKKHWSHTLYDTDMLVRENKGKAPLTMQAFEKLVDRVGHPLTALPAPTARLPPVDVSLPGIKDAEVGVPTWQEMGFKEAPTAIFKGGETEALKRLEHYMKDTKWVASFEKPSTDPSAFTEPSTTALSPYLKFGCLSARFFHQRLLDVYRLHPKHSQPPMSLRGQLLWREFFYTLGSHTPNFDRIAGNPICRQITWDTNPALLKAWRDGATGYPWIDAAMTQLREWGWMHHLARHSVACFLTRGDLYLSWESGKEVFEELLLDADYFINAANWMWLSASAFFAQYFRVYSPVVFGKKYDKEGAYIRKFLPVLKDMPAKYIYEPWTAPKEVQQRANCIIGRDYPAPIVDHAVASKECIARMGAAYKATNTGGSAGKASPAKAASSGDAGTSASAGAPSSSKKTTGKRAASADQGGKRQKTLEESMTKKGASKKEAGK
uniref:Photolyase/cryptochrome alpha/beta domain-containing protein n=1 Tax=Dunaliella tertiolecta TaxID=3047 RepID=A0A7S3R4Y9_DUNTE